MPRSRRALRPLQLAVVLALGACRGVADPPALLLLISVDTLRADHLGAHGSQLGATPNLDRLAEESIVFTAAYAPSSHTLTSVSALMTGRYPEEIGVRNNESAVAASVPTLAAALREAGWRTHAVVSNWVLRRSSGLAAGFDGYDDTFPQLEATRPMPERIAADTTTAALRAIQGCRAERDARCFVWVHYQDPHGPYQPPDGLRERCLERERAAPDGRRGLPLLSDFSGIGGIPDYQAIDDQREIAFYRAGYDGEVAYLDQEIGRLLAGLGAEAERAIVVFSADHGESLGERDLWFAHGEHLTDAQVRVPIWLRVPGRRPARRDDVASLLDLHATLLRLATAAAADPVSHGRDLLAPDAAKGSSRIYLATLGGAKEKSYGWIEDGYKFIITYRDDIWQGQLFRLGDDTIDLAAPAPQLAASLRERITAFHERMPQIEPVVRAEPLSEDDRARLRALGYEAAPLEASRAGPETTDAAAVEAADPFLRPAGSPLEIAPRCEQVLYQGPQTALYSDRPYRTDGVVGALEGYSFCRSYRHGQGVWLFEVVRATTFLTLASERHQLEAAGWKRVDVRVRVDAAGLRLDRLYEYRIGPGRYAIHYGHGRTVNPVFWRSADAHVIVPSGTGQDE